MKQITDDSLLAPVTLSVSYTSLLKAVKRLLKRYERNLQPNDYADTKTLYLGDVTERSRGATVRYYRDYDGEEYVEFEWSVWADTVVEHTKFYVKKQNHLNGDTVSKAKQFFKEETGQEVLEILRTCHVPHYDIDDDDNYYGMP